MSLEWTAFRNYGLGKAASYEDNEFFAYLEEGKDSLTHRTGIAMAIARNGIFFESKSRETVERLMNDISILCNVELGRSAGNDLGGLKDIYWKMADKTSNAIDTLYKELNLG